jgi:hypothetical protein
MSLARIAVKLLGALDAPESRDRPFVTRHALRYPATTSMTKRLDSLALLLLLPLRGE